MTATVTVPASVRTIRTHYFQRRQVTGWTIVGTLLGLIAMLVFVYCMFGVEVDPVTTETTNPDGTIVQTTTYDDAWSRDALFGFLAPLGVFAIVCLLFTMRRIKSDVVQVLMGLAILGIGIGLGIWIANGVLDDLEIEMFLLGLAAAIAVMVALIASHVFYVRREQAIDNELVICKDWIARCETALNDAGVDLSTI